MKEESVPGVGLTSGAETKWINMVMGVLPGWWLGSEDGRAAEPYISSTRWDAELRRAGFAGAATVAYDGYLNNNIIAAPAEEVGVGVGVHHNHPPGRVTLLHLGDSPDEPALETLTAELQAAGFAVEARPLGGGLDAVPPGRDVVAALDLTRPFLHCLAAGQLAQLQRLLGRLRAGGAGILWVTGASQVGCVDPRYAPTVGVARVLRTETGADVATLELEDFARGSLSLVPRVLAEFQRRRGSYEGEGEGEGEMSLRSSVGPEAEWAVVGGRVLTGRYHFVKVPEELKACSSDGEGRDSPGVLKKLEQHRAGLASTLFWKEAPQPSLGGGMVRVKVKAVGMNFKVGEKAVQSFMRPQH